MIGFSIAIVLSCYSSLPAAGWLWCCAVFISYFLPLCRRYGVFSFCLGMVYVCLWGQWQMSHRLPAQEGAYDLVMTGVVTGLPDELSDRIRFELQVDQEDVTPLDKLRRVRLTWYRHTQSVQPGQRWRLSVRLKSPRSLVNPAGFDFSAWHLSRGIDARGYVRSDFVPELLGESNFGLVWFDRQRYELSRWLGSSDFVPRDIATLQALLLGDKRLLSESQWQLLKATGTVHLVVISGLHIGVACLLGYWIAALIQLPLVIGRIQVADLRLWRVFAGLLCAIIYAVLAGFTIPTQRALIMAVAILLPPVFGMWLTVWQRWWLALLLVLLVQPLSPLEAGFWLSFAAVAILLMAASRSSHAGFWSRIKNVIGAQAAIFIGLLPLLLLFTGSFSLISPVVNVFAIPYISLLLLPALVLLIPLMAVDLDDVPVVIIHEMLSIFWEVLGWLSENLTESWLVTLLEQRLSESVSFQTDYVLLASVGICLLFLPKIVSARIFGVFLCLPILFAGGESIPGKSFKAWVLDVGQGLSVLVKTTDHTLLFDTGASYQGGSVADGFVVPSLKRLGVHSLDWLIISHGDNDHAGGFVPVYRALRPGEILTGSAEWRVKQLDGSANYNISKCDPGRRWQIDGVAFRFIQSESVIAKKENNKSCVLLVENQQCRLILPGDAEAVVERQVALNENYLAAKYTWLVAGHHGSNTSTSRIWLDWLKPQKIIFSSGYNNRYGHPAKQVLQRVSMQSIPWLDTGQDGAVILSAGKGGCTTEALRHVKWRYWLVDSIRQ